jgi:putative heme-binding domain-containing protein
MPDIEAGKKVFTQHCAACHQVASVGGKVGPNIDGIGNRGLDRLLEDVLDSNRNVDAAFRATQLNMLDGRTITGLLLREEGEVYVLADNLGKEVRYPKNDVESKKTTPLSPMPANFDTLIPEADFANLVGYLLSLKTPAPK